MIGQIPRRQSRTDRQQSETAAISRPSTQAGKSDRSVVEMFELVDLLKTVLRYRAMIEQLESQARLSRQAAAG